MATFKPEYQVGDRVIIQDIPENEKDNYPPDWVAEMDDCVGIRLPLQKFSTRQIFTQYQKMILFGIVLISNQ
jgi:hypothetical protein